MTDSDANTLEQGRHFILPPSDARLVTVLTGRLEIYARTLADAPSFHKIFLAELGPGDACFPPPETLELCEFELLALEDSSFQTGDFDSVETDRLADDMAAWFGRLVKLHWLRRLIDLDDDVMSRWADATAFHGQDADRDAVYTRYLEQQEILTTLIYARFSAWDKRFDERARLSWERKDRMLQGAYGHLLRSQYHTAAMMAETLEDLGQPVKAIIRLVANHMGMEPTNLFIPTDIYNRLDPLTRLRRLAEKARIRLRLVNLSEGWERTDSGVLVGYYGEEKEIVGLLPEGSGGYRLYRPNEPVGLPVTGEVAANLHGDAFVCYPGLPADRLDATQAFGAILRAVWSRDWRTICLVSFLGGLIPLAMPLITKSIFSSIIPINDRQALGTLTQMMLVAGFVSVVFSFVRAVACVRMKTRVGQALEAALWSRLLSLPAKFFRNYQVGDLFNRMQGATQLANVFDNSLVTAVFGFSSCFWSILLMLYYSVRLSLYTFAVWAAYLLVIGFVYRRTLTYQRRAVNAANRTTARVLEILNGLPVFKLRGAEEQAFFLWAKLFGEGWKWNLALRRLSNRIAMINVAQPIILNMLVFFVVTGMFQNPQGLPSGMDYATFLAFQTLFAGVNAGLVQFVPVISTIFSMAPQVENLKPILDAEPEVTRNKIEAGLLTGLVEVENLQFAYATGAPLVLKDVSFTVEPGQSVALVGASGCGKSTVVRLLLGFETPLQGGIYYDGQDLSALNTASVRSQIGVVLQNGQLMAGDIFTNIVGTLPLTMDDAWEAARMVGLDQDIEQMPMGMHTLISEGGGNLSGGQRQRVLIARSIVNRPRIVIMDEATSALDNITQSIVTNSLSRLKASRIIVAHRLSTIQNVDRIFVMDKGKIVEEGNYNELIALDGWFARLARRQLE